MIQQVNAEKQETDAAKIVPRNVQFDFNLDMEKYWYDKNSILTAWLCALSSMFPPGEKEFIRSIRTYEDEITDPRLKAEIKGFIGQEGFHQINHKRVNAFIEKKSGLRVTDLERGVTEHIQDMLKTAKLSDAQLLASTVSLEHITAIMGEWLLEHRSVITGPAPKVFSDLILWHAVEELEHKSVAFDVYMRCVGDRNLLRRVMFVTTLGFCFSLFRMQCKLLWWDRKLPSLRDIGGMLKFNFGKSGVIRNVFRPYLSFYRKDFHPDNTDETQLIREWIEAYPELAGSVK